MNNVVANFQFKAQRTYFVVLFGISFNKLFLGNRIFVVLIFVYVDSIVNVLEALKSDFIIPEIITSHFEHGINQEIVFLNVRLFGNAEMGCKSVITVYFFEWYFNNVKISK